jgi:chloramphenicol 3-O-phosphotransferase
MNNRRIAIAAVLQHGTAFLTDVIIMQRYIELHGCLERVMSVVKVPGSSHSKQNPHLRDHQDRASGR